VVNISTCDGVTSNTPAFLRLALRSLAALNIIILFLFE